MSDIQPGDVIAMDKFTSCYENAKLNFGRLSGKRQYAFLFLGAGSPEKPLNVNECMNAMGWAYDPKAADKQLAERLKAKATQQPMGD